MKKAICLSVILLFLSTASVIPQELNCKVSINTESIQSAQRDYLRNFASDIERYMNNTRFTNEDLDGERIQCNLDIVLTTASSDNRFTAQVVVASQRPIYIGDDISDRSTPVLRVLDNNWQFNYMPNQRMNHDEMVFDPLTSFLDFYAYLAIGLDLETYVPMSGSACFQKANKIVQLASSSSYAKDWQQTSASYSKFGIIDELTNMKYNSFRTSFNNYYYDGVDLFTTQKQTALANMLKAIESINELRQRYNPTSVIVKQFFDAKFREIAESFYNYSDRNVYEALSNYDQEHRSTYQEWKLKQQ
jgi:hypothetical protein